MIVYFMEIRKNFGYGTFPMGKAKAMDVRKWNEAKVKADEQQFFISSDIYIGEAIKDTGYVDLDKKYCHKDSKGWHDHLDTLTKRR